MNLTGDNRLILPTTFFHTVDLRIANVTIGSSVWENQYNIR